MRASVKSCEGWSSSRIRRRTDVAGIFPNRAAGTHRPSLARPSSPTRRRLTSPTPNGNGVIDGPAATEAGAAGFAAPGTEQDALAEYLAHFFAETPFDVAKVAPFEDRRVQNLGVPGVRDTVFDAPGDE